jgi:predicted O-linked N-acetylglucosamine transferase (SPINDLY family)
MAEPFEHPTTISTQDGKASKLRIGYVASGFVGTTAVQHLSGVFLSHSHAGHVNAAEGHVGTEVRCFSLLPGGRNEETDKIDKWLNSRWVDLSSRSMADAAQRIRDERVHILVSVDGFNPAERAAVVAMKPAPIQVGYRSHPGSLGAEWLDYSIADVVTTPPSAAALNTEKAALMPYTSHANDYWRLRRVHDLAPMRMGDREDYGLPENRVVLQHLGLYGRIGPLTWASWMNMVNRLPNATLWLLRASNEGESRLEAQLKAILKCLVCHD